MTEANHSDPICPVHETLMLPHKFEEWELQGVRESVNGFRCTNLSCPIVYVNEAEGFFVIEDGTLTPFSKSGVQ